MHLDRPFNKTLRHEEPIEMSFSMAVNTVVSLLSLINLATKLALHWHILFSTSNKITAGWSMLYINLFHKHFEE